MEGLTTESGIQLISPPDFSWDSFDGRDADSGGRCGLGRRRLELTLGGTKAGRRSKRTSARRHPLLESQVERFLKPISDRNSATRLWIRPNLHKPEPHRLAHQPVTRPSESIAPVSSSAAINASSGRQPSSQQRRNQEWSILLISLGSTDQLRPTARTSSYQTWYGTRYRDIRQPS